MEPLQKTRKGLQIRMKKKLELLSTNGPKKIFKVVQISLKSCTIKKSADVLHF